MFEEIKKLVSDIIPKVVNKVSDPTKIDDYYQRKYNKVITAIEFVEKFNLETDKISATQYKELKQTLNDLNFSGFHQYLDKIEGYENYYQVFQRYPKLGELAYEVPTELYRITSNKIQKFKKLKLTGIEKDAVDIVVKRLEIFLPLAEKVAKMKDCVGKIQKEAKKTALRREAEQIRGKLDDKLKNYLEEIAEFFRKKVEQSRIDYYTNRLKNFDKTRVKRFSDIQDISDFLTYPGYEIKPNAFEIVPLRAKKDSEEVIQDFIYKMLLKLGGLVINFPDVEVSYDGGIYKNWIFFKLNKDTKFYVENNIVSGVSKYGVWFNRYPTTFHNVVINGEKITNPSELKVKKLLNDLNKKSP